MQPPQPVPPATDILSLRAAARARPRSLRSLSRLVAQSVALGGGRGGPRRSPCSASVARHRRGGAQITVAQWSLSAIIGGGERDDIVRRALPAVVLAVASAMSVVSGNAMALRSR